MARNFVAEIKELGPGDRCSLLINFYDDIGLSKRTLYIDLPEGTGMPEANTLALALNHSGASFRLD